MKSGNLNFPEPSGPLQACNGAALPLYMNYEHTINPTAYEASIPAHGNYAELATTFGA
jgi:hypothetical protein